MCGGVCNMATEFYVHAAVASPCLFHAPFCDKLSVPIPVGLPLSITVKEWAGKLGRSVIA